MESMEYGISTLSIIPVRKEPTEQSEMTTQILFGEHFKVVKEIEKWSQVQLAFDNYLGWIDTKMYEKISEKFYHSIDGNNSFITMELINILSILGSNQSLSISSGSTLPLINDKGTFKINNTEYHFKDMINNSPQKDSKSQIINTAKKYFNIPYLWGGKSSFGIDCSGLTQTVFKIHGITIPRDASQQVKMGTPISIEEKLPGDLAFFEDSQRKISHVGIIMENNQIIHASGKVRLDILDNKGILNIESNTYSHKLNCIKRYIN